MTEVLFEPLTAADVAAEAQAHHAACAARQLVRDAMLARTERSDGAAQADAYHHLCMLDEAALPSDALRRIASCVIRGADMPVDFEARRELRLVQDAPRWGWYPYQLAAFLASVPERAEIARAAIEVVRAARCADYEMIGRLAAVMSRARAVIRGHNEAVRDAA